jgi:hypothetical protein
MESVEFESPLGVVVNVMLTVGLFFAGCVTFALLGVGMTSLRYWRL